MATNGNGRTWAMVLFLAGLIASGAAAYVNLVDGKVDRLEDRLERRLEGIENKLDRLLGRNP